MNGVALWRRAFVLGLVGALPLASAVVFDLSEEVVDLVAMGGLLLLCAVCVGCQTSAGLSARRAGTGIARAVATATVACLFGSSAVLVIAAGLGSQRFLSDVDVSVGILLGALGMLCFAGVVSAVVVVVVVSASRRVGAG